MADLETGNTLRERADLPRTWFWLLLSANRWAVSLSLAVAVFGVFMLWGVLKPAGLAQTMQTSDMVETLFAGLVGAVITVTTLVVSINQLVLSQEIGSLGNQRKRMDRTMDVRRNTDDLVERTAPATPAAYVRELIEATEQRAQTLRDVVDERDDGALAEQVTAYVTDLTENADHATENLRGVEFGDFAVVSAMLEYNYDRKIHDIRRIAAAHEEALSETERAALANLLESLTMFGPVREYVKDLYIQWALVKLSRAILYAAIPALVVAGGMVVFVDPATVPGQTLGLDTLLWVVSAAFAVSVFPFLVFTAYILRLATLAKQTLSMGPLKLS